MVTFFAVEVFFGRASGIDGGVLSSTTMQIAAALLVCGLAIATLMPPPAANEDGLLTALLGAVCATTVLMGLLALFGVLTGTALLAAVGAGLMVPCAWLARAPEPPYYYDDEYDDDDGGGSPPPPRDPSPSPAPEHWRPAPAAPAPAGIFAAAAPARAALAQPAPAMAAAPRAELPANPRFPHLAAIAWGADVAPAAPPVPLAPVPSVVAAPAAPEPEPVFQAPAVRPARGDHRSVEHRVSTPPHAFRRQRRVVRLRMLHGWRRRGWFAAAARGEYTPR
jgi:hypothetical protein